VDELAGFALICWLLCPVGELGLSFPRGLLDAGDSQLFLERAIMFPAGVAGNISTGNEGDLIP
jgi:hypothetical protein